MVVFCTFKMQHKAKEKNIYVIPPLVLKQYNYSLGKGFSHSQLTKILGRSCGFTLKNCFWHVIAFCSFTFNERMVLVTTMVC